MARAIFGNMSQTSNTTPGVGGAGGTMGGRKVSSSAPGMNMAIGDEGYLWLLVIIEAVILGCCRKKFRRYHGG